MSPKRTEWSALFDVHYGSGRNRTRGLKIVHIGHPVDHHHAVRTAEQQEEAKHGTLRAVLERKHIHIVASLVSSEEHLPIFQS